MEQAQFISLLSSSAYVGGYSCWKIYKRWKKKNANKIFVVLTARKAGLTTQLNKIDIENSNVILIDSQETIINSQIEVEREHLRHLLDTDPDGFKIKFYPLLYKYIEDIKQINRNHLPIVIFSSDPNIVNYLGIKSKYVCTLLPSLTMINNLVKKFDDKEAKLLTENKEKLLTQRYEKFVYKSFSELVKIIEFFITPTRKNLVD